MGAPLHSLIIPRACHFFWEVDARYDVEEF